MTPIVPDSPGPSCFPLLSVAGFKNFNDLVLIPLCLARASALPRALRLTTLLAAQRVRGAAPRMAEIREPNSRVMINRAGPDFFGGI